MPCARYMPEDKWRSLLDGNVEEDNSEESEAVRLKNDIVAQPLNILHIDASNHGG